MANLTGQNIKDTYQELVTLGGNDTITNGTGSLITDLAVTASWADNAVSASYAPVDPLFSGSVASRLTTDENLISVNTALIGNLEAATGSYLDGGSVAGNVITLDRVNGTSITLTVDTGSAISASYAATASIAGRADTAAAADQSTLVLMTGTSTNSTYRVVFASSNGFQGARIDSEAFAFYYNPATNALAGLSSVTATTFNGLASSAVTASHALNADKLGGELPAYYATSTSVSSLSSSLSTRLTSDEAIISSLQGSVTALNTETGSLQSQISSLTAQTSSYAKTNVNNNFSGTQTFDNIAVNGTGSFAYIQSVTGSAKVIGDAFIILNNDTPTERYAGIKVIDSGSANTTASLQFDGLSNDWFYEYQGADPTNYGVVMFGPEYSTIGSPVYLTNNRVPKSTGGHHLEDSNISDSGTVVSISTPVSVTGAVTASAGFSGNLVGNVTGNASTATSASYALTASYAANVPQGEATAESGNILFENIYGEIYGSAASPVTGNITVDGSSVKVDGAVAIIYHTGAVEPTISGATVNKKAGIYQSGSLNIITLTNIDGTNILEYIAGGSITSVASASFATSASYAASADSAVSASYAATGPFLTSIPSFQDVVSVGPAATGSIELNGLVYPSTDGTNGQAIVTDGAGNLAFASVVTEGTTDTGVTSVVFDNSIATVYNTAASPATGNITLSGTGAVVGGVAIIYHNDSSAPTISGLTVDKTLGVYSASNLNIITIIYTGANVIVSIAGISPAVEGSQESGDLLFENQIGEIYGSSGTPVTGNLTISASSTKVIGASVIVYHDDSAEPTVSGGTIVKKVGSYDTGGLNMISFVYLGDGKYIQSIAGADVTGIITNSADTYTSTAKVQSVVTCTAAEYAAIGTPDANTFYIVI